MERARSLWSASVGCLLLAVLALLGACAGTPRPEPSSTVERPQFVSRAGQPAGGFLRDGCTEKGICLAYSLQGECPNWKPALALAKTKAGCGGLGADDAKAIACRKKFACDICQFLESERWPVAEIQVYPGGPWLLERHEGATVPGVQYTPGSFQSVWIVLRQARCYGPGVGIWPFWEDNVEILAKALIHESLHVCKYVGAYGPSSSEESVTKAVVEECF